MLTLKVYSHLTPFLMDRLAQEGVRVVAEGQLKKGVAHTLDVPVLATLALPPDSVIHEDKWLPDSLGEYGPLAPQLVATLPSGRRLVRVFGPNGGEDIDIWPATTRTEE